MSTETRTWTTERVDQLRRYVEAGFSCGQIAGEIGLTRNAVIGKIHRLRLWRGAPPSVRLKTRPQRRPAVLTQRRLLEAAFAETAVAAETIESAARCSLVDLAAGKCRWPLGDPAANDFCFCGNEAVAGLSYCVGHARLAYRRAAR